MATLQFLGAARHVTGSKYLLTANGKRVLFECGLVQGPRAVSNKANRELGVDAKTVDGVVLSHAHIDHSGALPRLVKLGYHGPIHCTQPTAELVAVLLRDSAHLQALDAKHLRKRGIVIEPPYDIEDVERTIAQLEGHDYNQPFEVIAGVGVEFFAHPDLWDEQTKRLLASGRDPFFFEGVRFVQDAEESKTLNSVRQGIIIAASGMCEGGRILHHLKQTISRPEDCVLIVGYMAQGTLGRKLVDGYEYVNILGERFRVRCKVRSLLGLSAHADYKDLLASLGHLANDTKQVFVVHGEEDPAMRFADRLRDAGFKDVHVPVRGEVCAL